MELKNEEMTKKEKLKEEGINNLLEILRMEKEIKKNFTGLMKKLREGRGDKERAGLGKSFNGWVNGYSGVLINTLREFIEKNKSFVDFTNLLLESHENGEAIFNEILKESHKKEEGKEKQEKKRQ